MAELKTIVNDNDVNDFLHSIDDDKKRADSLALLEMFTQLTHEKPKMWGASIVGFGQYHYKSERSSQEGDWMLTGFSPRKQNLTLYIMNGFDGYTDLLRQLGKHKTSKSCLYIRKLEDIDQGILEKIITHSYLAMKKNNS